MAILLDRSAITSGVASSYDPKDGTEPFTTLTAAPASEKQRKDNIGNIAKIIHASAWKNFL
jgi:hypothetical protein